MERKLKRFNILLDDESLLYFPGSFLTGKVLLEVEENTPVTGLHFHIVGEGVVSFKGERTGAGGKRGAPATDRETYIDFRMRFLGEGAGLGEAECEAEDELAPDSDDSEASAARIIVLSPGVHNFPFKLGLPQHLPSTFLGLHGWVQYFCRAILREPSGLVHKNQQVFIVINPIDLNTEPANLQQPFYCEAEEELGKGVCAPGGLISCRVRLDRGGYVPGEAIQVSASVENASRLSIRRTRASLTETVEYRAKTSLVQEETRELASVEGAKIGPHSTDVWRRQLLHIPALPPTNLRGCHLIKIQYEVLFEILTSNRSKPIKLQLPIVMATYPVRNPDGTLKRSKNAHYPHSLPVFRPWLGTLKTKQQQQQQQLKQ